MDQGATWYEARPRPRPHCVTWGPAQPPKGAQLPIFGHVYCGPTVAHLSYCWALVVQLTAEGLYTVQRAAPSPSKLPLCMEEYGPHLIHGSLAYPDPK